MNNKKKNRNRNKSKKQTKTFKIIKEPDFPPIPSLFGGDLVLEGAYDLTKLNYRTFVNDKIRRATRIINSGKKQSYLSDVKLLIELKKRIQDAQEYMFEFKEKFSDGDYMRGMKNFKIIYEELINMEKKFLKCTTDNNLIIICYDKTGIAEFINNIGAVYMVANTMEFEFCFYEDVYEYTGDMNDIHFCLPE